MATPPDPLSAPTMDNLYMLLDQHGDQLQALQHDIDSTPTNSPEFRNTIRWLVLSTVLYVRCMYDWFDEQKWPMQFCAWAARNLFELEIWTRYVLRKREYAERFAKDWIMDGIGIFESFQLWSESRGQARDPGRDRELAKLYSMRDAELPGCTRFLDPRAYVAELGIEQNYRHLNPIFSKLVHPTSWSVHWKQELLDKTHMRGFIITIGLTSSVRIANAVRDHLAAHGMEPVG